MASPFQTGELILAPLSGYTHSPFRRLVRGLGADRVWTELVSADMVLKKGTEDPLLFFTPEERPIVVQLFGHDPEKIYQAGVKVARELSPDGLDLNLGCPAQKIVSRGAGAGLLKDLDRLSACAEALVSAGRAFNIPVSAKFRLGWSQDCLEEIAERLVRAGVSVLVLHPRLGREGFSGKARWERIRDLVNLVGKEALVVGNGDIVSWQDIERMFAETGCQAVMIGRACLRNPWIFKEYRLKRSLAPGLSTRVDWALKLLELMFEVFRRETACQKIKALLAQLFKGLPHRRKFLPPLLLAPTCDILIKQLKNLKEKSYESHKGPKNLNGNPTFNRAPTYP